MNARERERGGEREKRYRTRNLLFNSSARVLRLRLNLLHELLEARGKRRRRENKSQPKKNDVWVLLKVII